MKSEQNTSLNIHPLLLSLFFAINIIIVVIFQFYFIYTIQPSEIEILRSNGHYDPDFSDVPFFSNKEILDSGGWIFEEIVLYRNEDGGVEIVRLKENLFARNQFALDRNSITPVSEDGTTTVSMRNFLGFDKIVISNQSEIMSIEGFGLFRNQNNILFAIGLYAFLLLILECTAVALYQNCRKKIKYRIQE